MPVTVAGSTNPSVRNVIAPLLCSDQLSRKMPLVIVVVVSVERSAFGAASSPCAVVPEHGTIERRFRVAHNNGATGKRCPVILEGNAVKGQ